MTAKFFHFAGINFRGWWNFEKLVGINFRGWWKKESTNKSIKKIITFFFLFFFLINFNNSFVCIVSFAWRDSRNRGKRIPNVFCCHFFPFQHYFLCSLTRFWILFNFLLVKTRSQNFFVFRLCISFLYQLLISFHNEQINASARNWCSNLSCDFHSSLN